MSDELKISDGTKIERGVEGVKLTVVVGRVARDCGHTYAYDPEFYVAGTRVPRDDFGRICAMLALKWIQL